MAQGPGESDLATKLTICVGRGARVDGGPAYEAAVRLLRDRGIDGASVLLGVDGTLGGRRRRGRFLARNTEVPAMVISVGSAERIAEALPPWRSCSRTR